MATTVVGLYRTEADVQRVSDDLANSGFGRQEITRHDDTDPDLRNWLVDQGVPDREAADYVEGVRSGGKLVTVEVSDDRADEAVRIMQRHERTVAGAGTAVPADRSATTEAETTTRRPAKSGTRVEGEETLEVVEEELDVGTREVEGGGVRVSTYVTEKPVEKQVRVRDEKVDVERRPVDRPVSNAEADSAFQERAVEMSERTEDVVVGKQARVVEEVVLTKDVDERTETVRDTVRKTDVEVERTDDVLADHRDDYVTHHRDTFGGTEADYPEREPAYRYGIDLANHPDYRGRPWSEIAPAAREYWVRQNGETWMEYEPAVRYSYERASARGNR
jgi:uncharacterized protein (TIGR02271 family)